MGVELLRPGQCWCLQNCEPEIGIKGTERGTKTVAGSEGETRVKSETEGGTRIERGRGTERGRGEGLGKTW